MRFEVLRTFRSPAFLMAAVVLPLVVFCVAARGATPGSDHAHAMTGMAACGALLAAFSPATHIALDRRCGWLRQTRVTPLRQRAYLGAKVVTAFLVALPGVAVLYAVGFASGVRMAASQWLAMTDLLAVGLIPFVVMSIALGHVVRAEASTAVVAGLALTFALLGGAFGRFLDDGAAGRGIRLLPSYWLCQCGEGWSAEGWIVVAAWTAVMAAVAIPAYRWDARRC